jgi:hypothetical protein
MLTIEGTYKDGKVELAQIPPEVNQSRVLVTFLESNAVDLRERGIDETQAAELRARLKTFAEDWERPEADIYDKDPARCICGQIPPHKPCQPSGLSSFWMPL